MSHTGEANPLLGGPVTQATTQQAPLGTPLAPRDRETAEELSRFHPDVAGLFRLGFELVGRLAESGTVFLLGHVGRELANAVERYLAGEDPRTAPPDARTETSERETNRERIAAVLRLPPTHALVTRWFEAKKVFVSSCHYGAMPSSAKLREAFTDFTELLYGRVAPYFSTHRELDVLAATANPTTEQVSRARALLLRPQQRHYFFSRLKDPSWLKPLREAGQFDTPPDIEREPDGSWRPQAWPEGRYLIEVAPAEPGRVADVLIGMPSTNKNPAVWSAVVDAARAMPPSDAKRVVPGIIAALANAPAVVFPHDAVDLVRRLAVGGERSAFRLADALLWLASEETAVTGGQPSPSRGRGSEWILPRLSLWELSEFCETAVVALEELDPAKTIQLLAGKLARAVHLVETADPDEGRAGWTRHWCGDLEEASRSDDVREVLAVALAGAARRVAVIGREEAESAWESLRRDGEIFTRLRWLVLAAAGALLQRELDDVIGSDVLLDPTFGAREAAALLRSQFQNASPEARELFRHALERGPELAAVKRSVESERERFPQIASATPADVVARVVSRWQTKRIRWFHDRIPGDLASLASELGVTPTVPSPEQQDLDEVGFHTTAASWVGPDPSPAPVDALLRMRPEELVTYVRDWTGPQESFGQGPSLSGLDAALSEVARRDVQKGMSAAVLGLTAAARPQHVASLLAGVAGAQLGADVPWNDVVNAAVTLVREMRARTPREPSESWRFALRSVLQVVGKGASSGTIPWSAAPQVWEFIEEAVRALPEFVAGDASSEPTSFADIIHSSVNSLSGDTAARLVDVALWAYRESVRALGADPNSQPYIAELERRVVPLIEQLLAESGAAARNTRAVLGQFVPQLMLVAPTWMRRMEEPLFGGGVRHPLSDPLWPSYIVRGGFFDNVVTGLRHWYVQSAEAEWASAEDADQEWSPARGLTRHVMIAVLRGLVRVGDADALVEKTFSHVSAEVRAHTYSELERDWSQATSPVPAEFASRLIAFWEWRLAQLEAAPPTLARSEEAEGLVSFVTLPYIPVAAAIPLSVRTARLLDMNRRTRAHVWEALGRLASADASQTFEVLEILVNRELNAQFAFLPFDRVASALRAALAARDENVRGRATRLVHLLGERGHQEFGTLLDETGAHG